MMSLKEFKKFFLYTMIGSLIIAALVAVVTVLIGEFNEVAGKVMLTLLMVIVHSMVSLGFIWEDERQNTFENLLFFTKVIFILIVVSFIVSVFGVWDLLNGETVWEIYQIFFVVGFAALHGDVLAKALGKEGYLNKIVYTNYVFMVVVVFMLMPIILIENAIGILGEFFYRLLAASAIIDGTLSILAIIFYKNYMSKHPKEQSPLMYNATYQAAGQKPVKKKGLSVWVWVLIAYLAIQVSIIIIGGLIALAY